MGYKHLLPLLLFAVYAISMSSSLSHPQINVWPKPVKIWWPTPTTTLLSPSFNIHSPYDHKYLRSAVYRYNHVVQTERYHFVRALHSNVSIVTSSQLQSLNVYVHDIECPLQHGVDETYSLKIAAGNSVANLTAQTVWGAMHGLETFSQLVWVAKGLTVVPVDLYIEDGPMFAHRGVMIDTGRNYIPPKDIMRSIRAMGSNKINVFHWHITDSQSFPIVLPSEPDLGKKGSYGPKMQYLPSDVRMIVEYAMQHGVRVVPEIDIPAHSGSWAKAHPEIVTCADMFWLPEGATWPDRLAAEPGTGQLNPLNPKTYDVVENVIRDATILFPDHFYHSGADEVIPNCWKTDPTIQQFLSNNGTLDDILEIFINKTYPFIRSLNRTVVYWEDVLLDSTVHVNASSLPKEATILQSWNNGPNNTKLIVSNGYRAIVSSADFYYLDCGHGDFTGNDSRYDKQVSDDPGVPFNFVHGNGGSWCGPYKTWQRVYDYDITYGLTEDEAKLVIGGEVALWTEQVDEVNLDARIWPRASAMAEALWSGNRDESGKKRYADATDRLNEWRYRMIARGIGAEVIQPLWCLKNPGMCNLVQ